MAKRPWWYLNAARRTLTTALPSLAQPDDGWAATHLRAGEYQLFMRLSPSERAHGIEVARRVLGVRPAAPSALVRAALLHDVGKLGFGSNVWHRVAAHLMPSSSAPAEPRLAGLAGARQAQTHHGDYGAALIVAAAGDRRVAELVRLHHRPGNDPEAQLLHEADELT
ncbi:MAG TPA: HD domain-containing protein [Trueperaceae bacterium]|nr:HD domain-containing protein [Trueperaceae bacterium]